MDEEFLKKLGLSIARGVPQMATGFVDLAGMPFTVTGLLEPEEVVGSTAYLTQKGLLPPPQEGVIPETVEMVSGAMSPGGGGKELLGGLLGVTAYHGSPYLFKQLDPARIGTGEGAQAYGAGAGYTAELRPVAESYRSDLTRDIFVDGKPILSKNRKTGTTGNSDVDDYIILSDGDIDEAISAAKQDMEQVAGSSMAGESAKSQYENIIKQLTDLKGKGAVSTIDAGYLYKGDIPDEIIPSFLDWDKPLSKQTTEVRNALQKRISNFEPSDNFDMGGGARLRDNREGQIDPDSTSPWFMEAENPVTGIQRFKISQADVDRMFGAKEAQDLTGEQIYTRLTQQMGSQQGATDYLNSVGVRGIRYLDQGSRTAKNGTSNLVVFRPEDYKIEEINDIPLEEYIRKGLLD